MYARLYDQLNGIPEQEYEATYQQLLQSLYVDPEIRQAIDADFAERTVPLRSRIAALMLDTLPVIGQ